MTPSELRPIPPARAIYANRTLNMRAIKAIGYDMDYTLIHYKVDEWERRAYTHLQQRLADRDWPVKDLEFDPHLVTRGLVIDTELGNVVKADRFGYVKRAFHGTQPMAFAEQKEVYARELVDLKEKRWVFLNTFFSISEACMYMQLVDHVDAGEGPRATGYADLYRKVRDNLDEAHMEGELKGEIAADPDAFVELDPDVPLTLLDQKEAGKRLLLITNSEWPYTKAMMTYAFDRFLPGSKTWRDLFDIVLAAAQKPAFFMGRMPLFAVDEPTELMRPVGRLSGDGIYAGGHAGLVERQLGLSGEEILYVGDHLFADVHVTKNILRWRTALVIRELEDELESLEAFEASQRRLSALMQKKTGYEQQLSDLRLGLLRLDKGYGRQPEEDRAILQARFETVRDELLRMDADVATLAKAAGELVNENWGLLMRAGNDKSNLARQVERYADVYMSRVSNFMHHTPFGYLRAPRGSLPHDPAADRGRADEDVDEGA
jgi:5'-nucleotidase